MIYYLTIFDYETGMNLIDLDLKYLDIDPFLIAGFFSAIYSFSKKVFLLDHKKIKLIQLDNIIFKVIPIFENLNIALIIVYKEHDNVESFIEEFKTLIAENEQIFKEEYYCHIMKRNNLNEQISELINRYNTILALELLELPTIKEIMKNNQYEFLEELRTLEPEELNRLEKRFKKLDMDFYKNLKKIRKVFNF